MSATSPKDKFRFRSSPTGKEISSQGGRRRRCLFRFSEGRERRHRLVAPARREASKSGRTSRRHSTKAGSSRAYRRQGQGRLQGRCRRARHSSPVPMWTFGRAEISTASSAPRIASPFSSSTARAATSSFRAAAPREGAGSTKDGDSQSTRRGRHPRRHGQKHHGLRRVRRPRRHRRHPPYQRHVLGTDRPSLRDRPGRRQGQGRGAQVRQREGAYLPRHETAHSRSVAHRGGKVPDRRRVFRARSSASWTTAPSWSWKAASKA